MGICEIKLLEDLGGALGACFFEFGGFEEDGTAHFADEMAAKGHVLGDIEPV